MNGNAHFASVGDAPNEAHYEHGVQVIDEDKQFRFVCSLLAVSDISHSLAFWVLAGSPDLAVWLLVNPLRRGGRRDIVQT